MEYEKKYEDAGPEFVLTKIVSDKDIQLKISSSSNNPNWLILEDINNEDEDMDYVPIPKSKEGVDKLIKLLEKARDKFFGLEDLGVVLTKNS